MSARASILPWLSRLALVAACLSGSAVAPVCATTIALGNSGWEASFDTGDQQQMDFAVYSFDRRFAGGAGAVSFTKWVRFLPSLDTSAVTFRQTSASAARFIVIADEVIINDSGEEWTGYSKILADGAGVSFAATPPGGLSAGGYTEIGPFTDGFFGADSRSYEIDGGTLSQGGVWSPGSSPFGGGHLTIKVQSLGDGSEGNPFTEFTLVDRFRTEVAIPAPPHAGWGVIFVPEPGTLALVILGAVTFGFRRRRAGGDPRRG